MPGQKSDVVIIAARQKALEKVDTRMRNASFLFAVGPMTDRPSAIEILYLIRFEGEESEDRGGGVGQRGGRHSSRALLWSGR